MAMVPHSFVLMMASLLCLGRIGCNPPAAKANSLGDEIEKIVDGALLVETLTSFMSSLTSFEAIEACANEIPSLRDVKTRFESQAQLLLARANQAEEKIKEANTKRAQQDDLTNAYSSIWKNIKKLFKTQQKLLLGLDGFLKDSVMYRSAQIGVDVMSGNKESWTVRKVKTALLEEMIDVKEIASTLSTSVKYIMDDVLPKAIDYYMADQVVSALRFSSLNNSMVNDAEISTRLPFTDHYISQNLGRAVKIQRGVLTTGVDEAEEFTTYSDSTINEATSVHDSVNEISASMACSDIQTRVDEAMQNLQELYNNMQGNELASAAKYLEVVENNEAVVMNTVMSQRSDGSFTSALQAIDNILPDNSKRSERMQQAVSSIVSNVDFSDSIPQLEQQIEEVISHVDFLSKATTCYVKILEVIGQIIEGCAEGAGNFDSIHQEITTAANINNDRCQEDAMLQLPSKADIKQTVQRAAAKLGFKADCTQNRQRDRPKPKLFVQFDDVDLDSDSFGKKLSATQRRTVCDLKKRSKSHSEIARLLKVEQNLVKLVKCKRRKRKISA